VAEAHPGLLRAVRELGVTGKLDAVRSALNAEVADRSGVLDGPEEMRAQGRLTPGKLHGMLPPRLDGEAVVEDLLHLVPAEFVDVSHLVGVHEARIAHHVAAIRQIDGEDRAATVLDR